MTTQLKDKILSFIIYNLEKTLWISLDENIRNAYEKAHIDAENLTNIDPTRMRSQNRRYYVDNAVAGIYSTTETKICSTDPKGEIYVVLQSGKITLSHIELHKDRKPRNAKHRKLLANKNAIFEKPQYDLFKEPPPQIEDALHIVIVVIHPEKNENSQGVPLEVLVTVPYTTWDGYHLEIPLNKICDKYSSEDLDNQQMADGAWPKLKKDIEKEESPFADDAG